MASDDRFGSCRIAQFVKLIFELNLKGMLHMAVSLSAFDPWTIFPWDFSLIVGKKDLVKEWDIVLQIVNTSL